MIEPNEVDRVYDEREIGRILKRATELQHAEPSAPSASGVTLTELEEIAAEAGIDPTYLRRAALDIDSGATDRSFWATVVGEDILLNRAVTLPGELSDDGFERIVATIQTQTRLHGQPSLLGRTLTWGAETANKSRTLQIVVTSRDGRTDIRLEENLGQLAAGLFAGMTSGFGIGAGMGVGLPIGLKLLGSVAFAIAAPVGVMGLAYLGSRAIYRAIVRRRRQAISHLFDRVVREAEASIAATTVVGPKPAGELPAGE
jgi:hypothetical protein